MLISLVSIAISIIGGLLAASSFIVSHKPKTYELIDKLTPYQALFGIVILVWGISDLFDISSSFRILFILHTFSEISVGFLLSYGFLSKYIFERNETAILIGRRIRTRLIKYQLPAGLILILISIVRLIKIFLIHSPVFNQY